MIRIVLTFDNTQQGIELYFYNFQSLHDAAEFHAVARAIGGCGVYVRYASFVPLDYTI